MRIIAKSRLDKYGKEYGPDAESQLRAWYQEAKEAEWRSPQDIVGRYKGADVVGKEIFIFDICRNHYRLIVNVCFATQEVYIKHFLTHAEYDRLDVKGSFDEARKNRK